MSITRRAKFVNKTLIWINSMAGASVSSSRMVMLGRQATELRVSLWAALVDRFDRLDDHAWFPIVGRKSEINSVLYVKWGRRWLCFPGRAKADLTVNFQIDLGRREIENDSLHDIHLLRAVMDGVTQSYGLVPFLRFMMSNAYCSTV
jgi:hypothetical protein